MPRSQTVLGVEYCVHCRPRPVSPGDPDRDGSDIAGSERDNTSDSVKVWGAKGVLV